jgi:hypothetical protein
MSSEAASILTQRTTSADTVPCLRRGAAFASRFGVAVAHGGHSLAGGRTEPVGRVDYFRGK